MSQGLLGQPLFQDGFTNGFLVQSSDYGIPSDSERQRSTSQLFRIDIAGDHPDVHQTGQDVSHAFARPSGLEVYLYSGILFLKLFGPADSQRIKGPGSGDA